MKRFLLIAIVAALCLCSCEEATAPAESSAESIDESSVVSEETIDNSKLPQEDTTEASGDESSFESSEADEKIYKSDNYSYKLNNEVATIVGYSGDEESVTVPEELEGFTVSAIGERAFAGNKDVKSVSVGDTVVNIAAEAFSDCVTLESITVGSSVMVIAANAFDGCAKLTSISVSSGNATFSSKDGIMYDANRTTILRCPQAYTFAEGFKLLDTVVAVGESAFEECSGLTAIEIPNSCTVGKRAFFHCMNLSSVSIGSGIQVLPERCFFGCALLEKINVPEGVTEIGDYAFFGCVFADTLSLPESVTKIADNAFECCTSLKNITVKGDCATQWYEKFKENSES